MTLDLCASTRDWIARSPSRPEIEDFAGWLKAERYTDFVCDRHLRRLLLLLPRLSRDGGCRTYSDAQLDRVFGAEHFPQSRLDRFAASRRVYRRFLIATDRFREDQACGRFAALRRDYAGYLVAVRGLSLSSRGHHAQEVADFLNRGLRPRQQLRSLRRTDIERFIQIRSRETSRHSMQHTVGILRSFLRYIHHAGLIPAPLDSLDTPRVHRGELPPRALPWRSVRTLLRSIDRRSKSGWRDLCILHLIACYGLRPSEVVALRLDSIDWDVGVLHVRQLKTRSDLLLPLAPPTLRLLSKYLVHCRNGQGTTHNELFLRARCPSGRLEHFAVGDIFRKRAREAGLQITNKHVYRLRHTFAMRLLTRGVGIKAIGDVLGHRSLEGTCAYLRLDVGMLRDVALPVPGAGTAADRGASHA
jgi:integrase/recombinase XerD